jgi:hypothetical protein
MVLKAKYEHSREMGISKTKLLIVGLVGRHKLAIHINSFLFIYSVSDLALFKPPNFLLIVFIYSIYNWF